MNYCLSLFLGNLHVPKIYKQTTAGGWGAEPRAWWKNHFLAYDCQSEDTLGYSLTMTDATASESHPRPGSKIAVIQEGQCLSAPFLQHKPGIDIWLEGAVTLEGNMDFGWQL